MSLWINHSCSIVSPFIRHNRNTSIYEILLACFSISKWLIILLACFGISKWLIILLGSSCLNHHVKRPCSTTLVVFLDCRGVFPRTHACWQMTQLSAIEPFCSWTFEKNSKNIMLRSKIAFAKHGTPLRIGVPFLNRWGIYAGMDGWMSLRCLACN